MVRTDAGEDHIVLCDKCGYAANVEKATSTARRMSTMATGNRRLEEFTLPRAFIRSRTLTTFPEALRPDRQIKDSGLRAR